MKVLIEKKKSPTYYSKASVEREDELQMRNVYFIMNIIFAQPSLCVPTPELWLRASL